MTVSHLSLDPAAIACCWVEDNVSAPFDSGMAEMILRWRDSGDLPQGDLWRAIAARFVQRRPDQAERIAQAAQDWAERHYPPHRFWSAILAPPS
jgi:hypothetical protein